MQKEIKTRKNDTTSNRISWLDTARAFAIMLVVLCHVTENIYFYSGIDILERSIISQFIGFSLFTLGRLGVPIFLFISGYLSLSRTYNTENCFKFWKHNLLPLFIASELWIVIYYIFICTFNATPISSVALMKNMLFVGLDRISYLWYLPTILGIYLCIPFVATALQKFNKKAIILPLLIALIYYSLIPTANVLLNALEYPLLSSQLSLNFSGGIYGIYIIIGYLFYKNIFPKAKYTHLGIGLIISVILTAVFQMAIRHLGYVYSIWYDFILLPFAAIFLFALIKKLPSAHILEYCENSLAKYAFGIYLTHKPVQSIVERYFPFTNIAAPIKLFILWALITIISFLITVALSKITIIRKYIFLIK